MLPAVKIVVLLREPVSRAVSAFNVRWLTWLCGRLLWKQADCWSLVTDERTVRANQVGPFQMHAALKLWRACGPVAAGRLLPSTSVWPLFGLGLASVWPLFGLCSASVQPLFSL